MQEPVRRSNKDRSVAMRSALVSAGRALFVQNGFAATGTPEIVTAAGVTRGALYHHFTDKTALFDAVVVAEAEAVAAAIRATDFTGLTAVARLIRGGEVFLSAMQEPGRARLMLLEGPAVLGPARLAEIDAETGGGTLVDGLKDILPDTAPVAELAALLSAAFDRAALAVAVAVAAGDPLDRWHQALRQIITGMVAQYAKDPAR